MKDFYYRIAKDERSWLNKMKGTKLSAADIWNKVDEMRARREKEAWLRDLWSKWAKWDEEERQKLKLL